MHESNQQPVHLHLNLINLILVIHLIYGFENFENKFLKLNFLAEVAQSFLEFDIDDGRSSKLCQNEDDSEYYSQLEVEYKKGLLYFE